LRAKAEAARAKAAEEKAKAEAEAKAREEEEARKREEEAAAAKENARRESEAKAITEKAEKSKKQQDSEKARVDAIRMLAEKARREAETRSKADREKQAKAKAEADEKRKAEEEEIKKAAEEKARLEAETKEKETAEAEAKAEAEAAEKAEEKAGEEAAETEEKPKTEEESARAEDQEESPEPSKTDEEAGEPAKAGASKDDEQEAREEAEAAAALARADSDHVKAATRQEADVEESAPEPEGGESGDPADARAREEAEAMARAVEDRQEEDVAAVEPEAVEPEAEPPSGRKAGAAALPGAKASVAREMKAVKPRGRRRSWGGLVAGILVLLMLGGGGAGYWYYQDQQKKKEQAKQSQIAGLLQQASKAMKDKQYVDALGMYERVIAVDPGNNSAKTGKQRVRDAIEAEKAQAEKEKEKARLEAEKKQKELEEKMARELAEAKAAAEKKRQEAEAKAAAEAEARRKAEEKAEEEAAARMKAEEEARRKAEAEAKARAEAEAARIAAEQARLKAEQEEKAKAEAERMAREEAAAKAREVELAAAKKALADAVLLADRGDFPAAYASLDKARQAGQDPVPAGRQVVQKELSALFALEDKEAKSRGYRAVLSERGDYLTDDLRDKTVQQVIRIDPPAGLVPLEKNAQGALEFRCAKDGSVMIYVPGGEFLMGNDRGGENERPARKVHVNGYFIDKHEITVAQFRTFVESTKYVTEAERSGGADVWTEGTWVTKPDASWKNPYYDQDDTYPVTCVTWNDVSAYCAWAGKRLPTEAEWEKASRGTDGRMYPWGNGKWINADEEYLLNAGPGTQDDDDAEMAIDVGTYPGGASPYGLLDMAGNVAEWCFDWYDAEYYRGAPARNPRGPGSGTFRIRRGGSWFSEPSRCRSSARIWSPPVDRNSITGFRCARSAP
jgi:formylglycine-generating enzyme required for sulfatase activity